LFEKLLSKGFKQNEGQFFTPLPITRFIWDSLPLKTIMKGGKLPTVIDYSCGAGHFLIEAVEAINHYRKSKKTDWARNSIFGVEKDYRLARVAKISLFMHGAGDANIIFGDGLETNAEKQILDNKFSILVANPPYSVQGFKSHLKIKNKGSFLILDKISNEGSEIECLFVERTAQLLAPNGVAAIILPSSILSNNSNSYVAARENILNNFMIKAIVSLGSGTFSETGTNTVILFLQKYNEPPKMSDLAKDCLSFIFDSLGELSLLKDWKEKEIYTSFLSLIGVSEDVYGSFLKEEYSYDDLMQGEEVSLNYFKQYAALIFSSSTIKNMEGKKFFAEMDVEAQKKEKMKYFYREVKEKEREKLLYFSLLFGHKTLLVRSPESNDAQKEFLGYGWSKRKGDEGIKIIKLGGTLYAGDDREAEGTIAFLIRNAFEGSFEIDEKMKTYAQVVMSTSLLDFSNSSFTKSIKTVIKEKTEIKSKWKMVRLGEMCEIIRGLTYNKKDQVPYRTNNIVLPSDNISLRGELVIEKEIFLSEKKHFDNSKKLIAEDIFMCFSSGSKTHVGKLCYIPKNTNYFAGGFMGILRIKIAKSLILSRYLFYLLNHENMRYIIREKSNGANINNLSNSIDQIFIPLPSLDVQNQLVVECEEVDKEYESSRMSIEEYKRKIEMLFKELEIVEKTGGGRRKKLSEICNVAFGQSPKSKFYNNIHEGLPFYQGKKDFVDIFLQNSNIWTTQITKVSFLNDILISVRAPVGDINLNPFERICIGRGLATIKANDEILQLFLFYFIKANKNIFKGRQGMAFDSINREELLNISIPVPPLSIQKELVAKAEVFETEISKHTKIMNEAKAKKEAIIKKYIL